MKTKKLTHTILGLASLLLLMKHDGFAATRSVPSQYGSVQAAINAAASGDTIQIANGTYNERVTIPSGKNRLTINGASNSGTIISSGYGQTTLTVNGSDINIQNLTLRNTDRTANTVSHALFVYGARVAVRWCYVNGWQDTLGVWNGASFYCSGSEVQGAVDFVYGDGRAFFNSSTIRQMRGSPTGGVNCAPYTASSQNYGLVFSSCTITAAGGVPGGSTYLMRPWGAYGQCAHINCSIGGHIASVGYIEFQGTQNSRTCRAAEYPCPSSRASWVKRLTSSEAAQYTKSNVLAGWNPAN